jgi:DNA-binding NarL/FixJ family response regulator
LSLVPVRSHIESMKLLVVDDHPVPRGGLCALLLQNEKDVVILQAGDAEQGLALVTEHADLDILDIAMPGMDGFQTMKELGRPRPELPVIVLSSSENPKDVRQVLPQGALGYVPKSASQHMLLGAVRLVINGDVLADLGALENLRVGPFTRHASACCPNAFLCRTCGATLRCKTHMRQH